MMGRQTVDQSQLFYLFHLEEQIPADHLLRRLNLIVTRVLVDLRTNRAVAITSDLVRIVNENIRGVSQFDSVRRFAARSIRTAADRTKSWPARFDSTGKCL
jgi:hypothetical protein